MKQIKMVHTGKVCDEIYIKGVNIPDSIISVCVKGLNDISDTIAYIKHYGFKKVIVECDNISDIDTISSFIDDVSIDIVVSNTISRQKMEEIYNYISSSDRRIRVCAKFVNGDTANIFNVFRSYIGMIDINDCDCKDKCINDSKIIHFDGDIICDENINIDSRCSDKTMYGLIYGDSDQEIFTFIDFDNPSFEKTYTYKEFDVEVNKAAKALIKSGVKKGSHVGIWMNSTPEWFIYFFAIEKIGAIAVPINKDNRSNEMRHVLEKCDIDTIIMSNGHSRNCYMNTMKELIPEINNGCVKNSRFLHLRNIVTVGFNQNGCISHEDFISNGESISDEEEAKMASNVYNDDIAIILPTSGTTGAPKFVMLKHEAIIHNGNYIGDGLELSQNDTMGIIVTMFHCFGMTLSMSSAMTHRTKMIIPALYKPYDTIEMIHKYGVTCMNGAPKHFEGLIDAYEKFINDTGCKITSLKKGIMAGANCSPKLMGIVDKVFGMRVNSVYGQTELAPGDTMSYVSDDASVRHNTVGKKFDYVDMRVVDDDDNEVTDGCIGEIVVKSPDVMVGYYGDINATNEMYDSNGYFHSGDFAIRENDYYKIVGRKKDMIIRNGENIQSSEVEEAMRSISFVKDACVFGIEIDDSGNQEVAAAVVIDSSNITEYDIICMLKSKIAGFKVPKKVWFVSELKTNANGKVVKKDQKEFCIQYERARLASVMGGVMKKKVING